MWRREYGCFSGDTRCFDVYFGVKRHTEWGKTKNLSGLVRLVCMAYKCIFICLYVCKKCVCICLCVCVCVWWHLLCCWLGAERSGLREPQTKEMKAEVTTWTGGTRSARSHNTQIQSHTCKRWEMRTDCMHNRHAHTADICFSHTENAEGGECKNTRTRVEKQKQGKDKAVSKQNSVLRE